MSNALITPTVIAKESLMQLENALVFGNNCHREYKNEFVKIGDSVTIRKPVKFVSKDGATLQKQDVEEGSTSITIDKRKHVAWGFNTKDLTLTIEEYSERYIKPAMITLAQDVESALADLYKSVWNFAGSPGTVPSTFAELGAAGRILDDGAVPSAGRVGVHNPETAWKLADGLKGVFVQDKARSAYEEARIGRYARADNFMSQSVKAHTVGDYAGTIKVDGADQDVTYASSKTTNAQTIDLKGFTASKAVKQGDVFTIADVYAVNPVSKQSTGALQRFVFNEDKSADGSGDMANVSISPAIITEGPYQNVDSVPADEAAITIKTGTALAQYAQNLVYHPNAFALVNVPLEMPDSVNFKAQENYRGINIRVLKTYDNVNDEEVIRLDLLFGVKAIYPDLACRLTA